jgi:hypothetical protein
MPVKKKRNFVKQSLSTWPNQLFVAKLLENHAALRSHLFFAEKLGNHGSKESFGYSWTA